MNAINGISSMTVVRSILLVTTLVSAAILLPAQGSKSLHGFDLVHPSAPTQAISIRYPSVSTNMPLTPPIVGPANNQALVSNGSGGLNWSSAAPALSSVTAAVATNTIDHGNNPQTWSWSGASSLSQAWWLNGPSTYTSDQTAVRLSLSGANANATQTTTTLSINNTRTGTGAKNIGLMVEGAINDRAATILVTNGLSGFRTSAPTAIIQLGPGTSTANSGAPLKLQPFSLTLDRVAGNINFNGEVFQSSTAADMSGTMPSIMYRCLNDSLNNWSPTGSSWNNLFNSATALPTVTLEKGVYRVEILVGMTYDWSFGFRFNVAAGGTVEYLWMSAAYGDVSTAGNAHYVTCNTTNSNLVLSPDTGGGSPQMFIRGILNVTSATADVTPQWFADASNNGTNTWRNNTMKITKLGAIDGTLRVGKWD